MTKYKKPNQIEKLYSTLGLDKEKVWHKTKAVLSLYRKVVWSLQDSATSYVNDSVETYGKSLEKVLIFCMILSQLKRKKTLKSKLLICLKLNG